MADLPRATQTLVDASGAPAGGQGPLVIFGCAAQNADKVPRLFASVQSMIETHGYTAAADLLAFHINDTKKPAIFVPLPVVTAGAASSVDVTGVTGTSVITVTGASMDEMDAIVKVKKGGTIGSNGIVLSISCDGGRNYKDVRLGTANSYAIPYFGVTLHFATGTLVTGDVATFTASAPLWDNTGLSDGVTALANQQRGERSWLVVGDLADATHAGYVRDAANGYETSNDRFTVARCQVLDRDPDTQTFAQYVSAVDLAFATIASQKRVDLALGRVRRTSPITGYAPRRPVAWMASCIEYAHDVHVACWAKELGPASAWDMTDGNGKVVEYDERTIGGALAAGFTCARTWANGPNGTFVAMSLTRADGNSLMSRTHNMHVVNVYCTVVQRETEYCIGKVLQLTKDGTATVDSLKKCEERVNTALQNALLKDVLGEGPRASLATWRADPTSVLNTVGATLKGAGDLGLNGTIEQIATVTRVH